MLICLSQVLGLEEMVLVPPHHYCIVQNPVRRDAHGEVLLNEQSQVMLTDATLDDVCN